MTDRERFEKWISKPPFEKSVERWPDVAELYAWHGAYRDLSVALAWEAWQEGKTQWQSMETAPRDGTEVLFWGDGRVFTGQFFLGTLNPSDDIEPSAWMPLPKAPEGK